MNANFLLNSSDTEDTSDVSMRCEVPDGFAEKIRMATQFLGWSRRKLPSLFTGLLICAVFSAQEANHQDAFVPGTDGENRLVHQVRHELVMLPY